MKIRRDYSQPFFREAKRHRLRNSLIAAILGLLLGLAIVSRWQTVEQVVDSLIGIPATPTPLPSQLATRAALLAQGGDFSAADALLTQAVAERPENIAYLYEYGKVQIELGHYDEAYALGQTIVDLEARDVRGFALKATALVWSGDASVAIPIGLSGLELDSRFTSLYATLSRGYIDTQRWADGLDMGERGLAINSNDAELVRAYAYALQSVGAYDEAAEHLEHTIDLRPGLPAATLRIGCALFVAR